VHVAKSPKGGINHNRIIAKRSQENVAGRIRKKNRKIAPKGKWKRWESERRRLRCVLAEKKKGFERKRRDGRIEAGKGRGEVGRGNPRKKTAHAVIWQGKRLSSPTAGSTSQKARTDGRKTLLSCRAPERKRSQTTKKGGRVCGGEMQIRLLDSDF